MQGKGGTRGVLLVVAGLLGSLLYVHSAGGVARFGDVEPERFYTEAVQWMVDNQITTGTSANCFSPNDPVTRGQAAAFIWRMEGFPPPNGVHPFTDVLAPWQQDPVSWMYEEAITTGTTGTTYSPDDVLTRGQMAALLWRLANEPKGSPPHPFVDVVASWQQEAISWMAFLGITTGTSATMFSPDDTVTRGQLAAFFYRYKGSPPVQVVSDSPDCGTPPNPGDVKNCSSFADKGAAQRFHDYYFPFYGDVAKLDGDGNGIVCETLPTTTSTSTTTSTTTTGGGGGTTTTTSTTTTGGGGGTTTTTTTTTTNPPNGMALFLNTPTGPGTSTQSCQDCHGSTGGGGIGPQLNPNNFSVQFIVNQINAGPGVMPNDFEDRLTPAEIQAIAQFVAAW